MQPIIRLARADDTQGIVDTIRSVYDEYCFTWEEGGYHADIYDVEQHYMAKGHAFWVAEVGGQIVGAAALEVFAAVPGAPYERVWVEDNYRIAGADCALQRLYVRPEGRRGGVGSALFTATIDEARVRGRQAMEIWSDKRFTDAHRLYERFGAELVGDRICHDPDQSPEWGLVLRIADPEDAAEN